MPKHATLAKRLSPRKLSRQFNGKLSTFFLIACQQDTRTQMISLLPSKRTKISQLNTILNSYQLAGGTRGIYATGFLNYLYLLLISYVFAFSQCVALET